MQSKRLAFSLKCLLLFLLIYCRSNGHTYMDPHDRLEVTRKVIDSITLKETNEVARELCEHLSHLSPEKGVMPAAIIACFPMLNRDHSLFSVSDVEVADVISEALKEDLVALENTLVPDTLLTEADLRNKTNGVKPAWAMVEPRTSLGVLQRTLSNGMKVNMHTLRSEPQRASVRVYVPGGRLREDRQNGVGAVALGCRTIQEGGAFPGATREEVELFCIDHQV